MKSIKLSAGKETAAMNLFVNNLCKVAVLDYLHPSVTQLTLVSYYGHPGEKDVNHILQKQNDPKLAPYWSPHLCHLSLLLFFWSGL